MKRLIAFAFAFACLAGFDAAAADWKIEKLNYKTGVPLVGNVEIRAGYLPESDAVAFKGNVLYLEGLGDSMLNHDAFFRALAQNGYRVIAFDYMGQGGSMGYMNHTRLLDPIFPALEIRTLAKVVWEKFARTDSAKKLVIGWSTGGLAALGLAKDKWADAVVLIAPGLNPKLVVGEFFSITEESIACTTYADGANPHVEPMRPDNALLVPLFAKNLLETALVAELFWKVDPAVKGIVFFAGNDAYVHSERAADSMRATAPHFRVVEYPKACHEIHSSDPEARADLEAQTLDFLDSAVR